MISCIWGQLLDKLIMKNLFHNFALFVLFEFAINYLDLLDVRVADGFYLDLQLIICISINPQSPTYNLQQTTISNFATFSKITNKA